MTSAYGEVWASDTDLLARVRAALHSDPAVADLPIGLVGCGWIGGLQLAAYREEGLQVVALHDRHRQRAEAHRADYAPDATVYDSLDELLGHPGLRIVDVATHVDVRPDVVETCLRAGMSVLSQKPFVADLATGRHLIDVAAESPGTLAVNQNGRWAPHFGALLAIARGGLIGEVVSADFSVAWPHDLMVADKPAFTEMADLVLFDFGAHWFDMIAALHDEPGMEVRAVVDRRPGQTIGAPLQASAIVSGPAFVSTVVLRAGERHAESGRYRVSGTRGTVTHSGASLGGHLVRLDTDEGSATVQIADDWFRHGLAGTMRELAAAVAAGREPSHDARSSIRGLELAFAAAQSARTGAAVPAGAARSRA